MPDIAFRYQHIKFSHEAGNTRASLTSGRTLAAEEPWSSYTKSEWSFRVISQEKKEKISQLRGGKNKSSGAFHIWKLGDADKDEVCDGDEPY